MQLLFGDCVLDPDRRELTRGSKAIAVGPQVFDLLVYLVRNRERVVSKDDLLDAVWGRRIHRATREAIDEALRLFGEAMRLDPDFASAYAMPAWCHFWRKSNAWMTDRPTEIAEGARLARRAVELGSDDAVALARSGHALGRSAAGDAALAPPRSGPPRLQSPGLASDPTAGRPGHVRRRPATGRPAGMIGSR